MREKILLNQQWLFHQGDIEIFSPVAKGPVYMQAKVQEARIGPASWEYRDNAEDFSEYGEMADTHWDTVELPHDYIIGQEPKKENNFSLGGFRYENAWYRRRFTLDETDREKRISLYFEGVATHCTVYINGCLLWKNECGYTSFEVDITDFVSFERDNVAAVYVDATGHHEGWWYEGAGIYRPVWMIKTERVSVDLYGVYLHPEKKGETVWKVPVDVTVRNDDNHARCILLETVLYSPEGEMAAKLCSRGTVEARGKRTFYMEEKVDAPMLWDVEAPSLYTAVTRIYEDGILLDEVKDRFGFRSIRFDADEGFFLNERRVYLKGVNCHQDYGLTGKAVPKRVQRYRLKLLKQMGANAFRTSHYPHSEITMDALDEMGFLVYDETRLFSSSAEGMRQLEMLVKRDRNRPSVICWSVGNEEPGVTTLSGLRITQSMKAFIKKLDTTRPVAAALCHSPSTAMAVEALEVLGINYHLEEYEAVHKKYPDLPLIATECCATGTTRGCYFGENPERQYLPAYDRDTDSQFLGREKTWRFLMEHSYILGCFQWDGIEHRGEAKYPRLCSQSGAIDLYLQKKDAFYQNQSHWTAEPMIHLLPHWNLEGHEGEEIRVVAYTNCEEAELFLNGESLGRQILEPYGHGEWQVIYEPGILEAKAYRNQKAVALDRKVTSKKAVRLMLRLEDEGVAADGEDIAVVTCYAVDEDGKEVPDAEPAVTFTVNEYGVLLGSGSDISDATPPACGTRKMRAGLISAAVRAGTQKGVLRIWAKAEGMITGKLETQLL